MTQRQGSPSSSDTEYVLGYLDDETPISLSDESVSSQLIAVANTCSEEERDDEENVLKFEKNSMNKIMAIKTDVEKIKEEIIVTESEVLKSNFKKYEEVLMSKTLSLDNIQTKGIEKLKDARKEVILFVQECLNILDSRVNE